MQEPNYNPEHRDDINASMTDNETVTDKKEGRSRLWIWILVGLIAIAIIVVAQMFLRDAGNSETAENYKAQAQRACEEAVREEADDSTAEISDANVQVIGDEEPTYRYTVTGSVSGTNSEGTAVSSTFTCEATYSIGTAQTSANATLTE